MIPKEPNLPKEGEGKVIIPPVPKIAQVKYTLHPIVHDGLTVTCCHCKQYKKTADSFYITRDDGNPGTISCVKCLMVHLGLDFIKRYEKGEPVRRGAGEVWKTRRPKLRLIGSKKSKKKRPHK